MQKRELIKLKRIPIGIENFKELIDAHYYYVDKTSLIKDVLDVKVSMFIRPRRFGKTLNLSMLYYFFAIQQKENAYLFDGLEITKEIEIMEAQNQFPVIFLSLKDMKDSSFHNQLDNFKGIISEVVDENSELLDSTYLNEIDKRKLRKYLSEDMDEVELQYSLRFISQCLYKHYHQKVIILIDEYDVPLQNAYLRGYYNEMTDFLSNVLSSALKTNNILKAGVLTGCLRITKESIFTGLNNLNVYSILEEGCSLGFGFNQTEIDALMKYYDVFSYRNDMKEWYDGYNFGGNEIYNPWSTLLYMKKLILDNDKTPHSYWANTSGNDIIYHYIQCGDSEMKQDFDILSAGGAIEKTIKSDLTYREMDETENIYSFLLFTGYLKIEEKIGWNRYRLTIPNKEIKYIYIETFKEWFRKQMKENREEFADALLCEDVTQANRILNKVLFESISYFDYDEKFYHGILIGMLSSLPITSNQEAGLGRYDIAILPNYKKRKALLLELKVTTIEEKTEETAKLACQQILDKKYIEGLREKGYEDIVGYGIAFYKKSCFIVSLKDI